MVATATSDAGASQPKPLGLDVPQSLTRLFLFFFRKSIQCLDHNLYNTLGESGAAPCVQTHSYFYSDMYE